MESPKEAVEPPVEDRPETLPQQVSRLAGVANRTRAWWTPWACLAFFFALQAVFVHRLKLLEPLGIGNSPTTIVELVLYSYLGGFARVSLLLIGFGVALARGRVAVRWLVGLVAVVVLSTLSMRGDFALFSVYSHLFIWSIWVAVGLAVRATGRVVATRSSDALGRKGFPLSDLIWLTSVVALAFTVWRIAFSSLDPQAVAAPADPGVLQAIVMIAASLATTVIPPLPLLYAAFVPKHIGMGRLLAATFFLLACECAWAVFLIAQSGVGFGTPGWVYYAIHYLPPPLGYASGLIVVALWFRWAGYRLREAGTQRELPGTSLDASHV